MLKRKYESLGVQESAAVILSEVVKSKHSSGWCGKSEDILTEMRAVLAKFNVHCTHDANGNGIWELN